MPYNIQFRRRATKEYLNAISWYNDKSEKAALNFVSIVEKHWMLSKNNLIFFALFIKIFIRQKPKNILSTLFISLMRRMNLLL